MGWVLSRLLHPIQQIPIIGAGCSLDFGMAVDLGLVMLPKDGSPIGEGPSLAFIYMPVGIGDPPFSFMRMSATSPSLQVLEEDVSTVMEGGFGDHTAIVIRPSMDHWIEFFDELSL